MSKITYWTEAEDRILISLSGAPVTPELIAERLPGRTRYSCYSRCRVLGIPRPRWPKEPVKAVHHHVKPIVLRLFRAAAKAGDPCPRVAEIMEVVRLSESKIGGVTRALINDGALRLEYHGNNRRRVVFPDGAVSAWSMVDEPIATNPEQVARQRWETDEARAIFAGVWFDDAPVARDPRRAPQPVTHVRTEVTGAWA